MAGVSWRAAGVVLIATASFALIALGLIRTSTVLVVVGVAIAAVPLLLHLFLRHPGVFAAAPGLVLGFAPFAAVPGTGIPLAVMLALVLVPLAMLHPYRGRQPLGVLGGAVIVFILVCLVACLAAFTGGKGMWEYLKWAIATGTMITAVCLDDPLRRVLMRAFVLGAAVGGLFTVAMLILDPSGAWVDRFAFLGYGGDAAVNARTALVRGSEVLRASGLYVDPNSAGLVFLLALGIAGAVFAGARRAVLMAVLAGSLVATLSRSALLSLIVAALVLVVASRIHAAGRTAMVIAGLAMVAVITMVPAVSSRLFDSFNSRDVGASARLTALGNYPEQMSGFWLFGHGWHIREFYDPIYGYHVNFAANTPLIVIYRAGIFAGLVFLILLILALVLAVLAMRRGTPGAGVTGSVLIGLLFIGFQLDFPVVTMPPLAMAFALLLAQVQVLAREGRPLSSDPGPASPRLRSVHVAEVPA